MAGLSFFATLLVAVSGIWLFTSAIYRRYFHPLSKYPGPWLWAISPIPSYWYSLTGLLPLIIVDVHDKYGPVVRVGPDELSYVDGKAWKDIYGHKAGSSEFLKATMVKGKFTTVPSILAANRENHARFRRLLSHAFSEKGMREQEPLIRKYVDLLMTRLHENAKKGPVDMVSWFNYTTFDVIGDLTFGDSFQCLEEQRMHPWIEFVFGNVKIIVFILILHDYGLRDLFQMLVPKKLVKARKENYEFSDRKASQREKLGTNRGDFMDHVLKQEYPKGMTHDELASNSSALILAGSETTATALSGIVYNIASDPRILTELTQEIRGTFSKDSDITLLSVASLTYMGAVIEESMRLYPPVPQVSQRIVPDGGAAVLGEYLPAGTVVAVNHYAAYHTTLNFSKPQDFIPERWLDESHADHPRREQRAAFQPFSYGPRNCIGQNLAYAEMRLILAKLIYQFDIALASDDKWMENQKVFFLWQKRPLMVHLTPLPAV